MSFPTVQARATTNKSGSNSTTLSVSMPTGVAVGDLLLAFCSANVGVSCSGWTFTTVQPSGSAGLTIGYRTADGTEGSTQTFSSVSTHYGVVVLRIDGWDTATPPEFGTPNWSTSTTPTPASVTPSWGSADTLWIACFASTLNTAPASDPSGFSNETIAYTAGFGTNFRVVTTEKQQTTGVQTPGSFTTANCSWIGQTVAIKPLTATTITLTAATGSLSETGVASLFQVGMPSANGSFTETGGTVSLGVKQTSSVGAFTETGVAALFKVSLLSSVGAFVLTGNAAGIKMPVGTGSFALTGNAVTTLLKFAAATGAYAETGNAAVLTPKLGTSSGTFTASGLAALFRLNLAATTGSIVVSSPGAPLVTSMLAGPELGQFFVNGRDSTYIIIKAIPPDGYKSMRLIGGGHTYSVKDIVQYQRRHPRRR